MRPLISTLMFIILFCQQSVLHAQSNHLSLEQIIYITDSTYPGIKLYESKIKAREELSKGAKALMPPTIGIGLDRIPYKSGGHAEEGMLELPSQASLMITAEQMFSNPSRLKTRQRYLKSLSQADQNNRYWTKNRIVKEIKKLYYERYIAEKKLKHIHEAEKLMELLINTAEASYTYNRASLGSVFKAKARKEELKNMSLMEESTIAGSSIGINAYLGRNVNTPFSIDTVVRIPDHQLLDSSGMQLRPDIAAMESNIRTMELNKEYMRAGLKPEFGVQVTHMQMFKMPSMWAFMGMITLPIAPWSSGMYKSEVASMNYQIDAMNKEREEMSLMLNRMVSEKLVMLSNLKKQLINYEETIIPAYQKNYQELLVSYKQNTSDFFTLLDAWEMLLMKKIEMADKEKEVLMMSVDYEFETGIIK